MGRDGRGPGPSRYQAPAAYITPCMKTNKRVAQAGLFSPPQPSRPFCSALRFLHLPLLICCRCCRAAKDCLRAAKRAECKETSGDSNPPWEGDRMRCHMRLLGWRSRVCIPPEGRRSLPLCSARQVIAAQSGLSKGVTTRLLRTTLLGRPTVGGNNALLRCCSTAHLALLSLLMVGWAPSGRPRSLGSEPPPRWRRRRRQRQGVPPGEQPPYAMLSGRFARLLCG